MQLVEIPAVWTIEGDADRQEIEDLVGRVAERLEISPPEITGDSVMLPADYPKVEAVLDEVDPDWRDKGLTPPVA